MYTVLCNYCFTNIMVVSCLSHASAIHHHMHSISCMLEGMKASIAFMQSISPRTHYLKACLPEHTSPPRTHFLKGMHPQTHTLQAILPEHTLSQPTLPAHTFSRPPLHFRTHPLTILNNYCIINIMMVSCLSHAFRSCNLTCIRFHAYSNA